MNYPLEQLVIIKKKKLEEAEKVLLEKKRALEKEEEKLAKLVGERDKVQEHKDTKLQQLREKLDEGTTSDKVTQMKQYLKVVEEDLSLRNHRVKEQQKQVTAAEKQVELARADMLKKHHDVEKLEIHRKEWEKEMQKEEERKEELEADEMGSVLHMMKKKKKKHKEK